MFHDASFSMKLTDIMFDLGYIAANTSAEWDTKADIFNTETVTADDSGKVTLAYAPVPVVTGGKAYLFYRLASDGDAEYKKIKADSNVVDFGEDFANKEMCVLYRYSDDSVESITISSQFIPETLHAILTVALYAGDSCNAETSSKVGEVIIDIPRFQLSGSMELTMSATGASQSSLEGNALASGCTGCDGKAIYATITRKIQGGKWYDNIDELIIEEAEDDSTPAVIDVQKGSTQALKVYAAMKHGAPRVLTADDVIVNTDNSSIAEVNSLVLSGKTVGKTGLSVYLKDSVDEDGEYSVFNRFAVEVIE